MNYLRDPETGQRYRIYREPPCLSNLNWFLCGLAVGLVVLDVYLAWRLW